MDTWRRVVLCGLAGLAVLPAQAAFADDGGCFDFALPTADRLLGAKDVQRLVIRVEGPDREAGQAAEALAKEARKRGIEVVFSNRPWPAAGASMEAHAAQVCEESSAQLVASVHFLTGSNPKTASVEIRDSSGQQVGAMTSWMTGDQACPEVSPGLAASPSREMPSARWYGWQLVLADVGAYSMLLAHQGWPYLVTYTLFPAALHGANGRSDQSLRSFGLRLLPFLVGGVVAILSTACWEGKSDYETCDNGVTPFFLAAVMVSLLDDFVFAWKAAEVAPAPAASRPVGKSSSVSFAVGLIRSPNGAGLAVSGRF